MNIFLPFSILTVVFFIGCGQPQPANVKCSERPWMFNPNQNSKIGAVGSSMRTYSGSNNSQRTLAITRALDELSLQQGVKVTLSVDKRDTVVNDKATTSMDTKAKYSTDNRITAHIEDACKDRSSGEFFCLDATRLIYIESILDFYVNLIIFHLHSNQ